MSNFKVMNLATDEYVPINSHPLSAVEAVVWAWCDFSSEPYPRDYRSHPLLEFVSSRTVSCGEHPNVFSCRLDPEITPEQVFFIQHPQYQGCVITPFFLDTNTGMRLAFLNDPSGNYVGCVSRKGFASFTIHRR
jgi:hypothetical protein